MICPYCGSESLNVLDSRPIDNKIRRRRQCTSCGQRFNTYESIHMPEILVTKKDNTLEKFDKTKLLQSMSIAIKKRPVSINDINEIVDRIETLCWQKGKSQISTSEIGDIVLESLKELDVVAYVRFASVYKDFSDTESFRNFLDEIESNK